MRILVTGANGQVGYELLRALATHDAGVGARPRATGITKGACRAQARSYEEHRGDGRTPAIIPATRDGKLADGASCERIDLANDAATLHAALDRIAPDLIVNAAAYTAVDRAEDEPELAQRVNGDAVAVLGAWAARRGARVVHYSTDYVFDGGATKPYREDDATHPLGVYGCSKLAGELALRESGARHLIFRTAWVYAARGHNFLRTMLRLGAGRDELRVVDDQIGAPTPASLIAEVTALAVARWYGAADSASAKLDGVYHLVASGQTSWCGFARAIFERVPLLAPIPLNPPSRAKGKELHPLPQEGGRREAPGGCRRAPRVTAITTADYPTRAKRPAYSVLDTAKLRAAFGMELPDWQTALDDVLREVTTVG